MKHLQGQGFGLTARTRARRERKKKMVSFMVICECVCVLEFGSEVVMCVKSEAVRQMRVRGKVSVLYRALKGECNDVWAVQMSSTTLRREVQG